MNREQWKRKHDRHFGIRCEDETSAPAADSVIRPAPSSKVGGNVRQRRSAAAEPVEEIQSQDGV